ncbi:MAG: response regulator [Candidatus Brocadia sp. AMX2]|uniref:Response regulator receiver protein n=1 Tax=Candidatus Brocadia sinica JPN1 TaxID=1197129 RepID=A0ABQ0K133_9BACT|nr:MULTISPECIES: response regulator [Brocadia]KXK28584.1 MAG: two-component response regulator [Candidatus Brocadia sinica]MBC6933428.1 response regulator [Candidatus Brocadia sp.]MBL1167999.1 response regulator [Candidatus Brocadia sp. AMX1]NOG42578.1 response regulator [Planctomycetota bacterium]KAA0243030.1 MAG: response regulator [Candidatus Brocadia sp. AMX2]
MKTILIVENDKNQLLLYEYELSLEGYNIITAKDGYEALKKVKEHFSDLIVMDIILPGMDGVELMGRILSERKNIPIIINTAYGGYKDNFMTWSADTYIIKSSDLSELKNMVKELLGKTECRTP